jgi:hypothetical protein
MCFHRHRMEASLASPSLTLITKPKSFRILVDIYFSEWHATFLQRVPGCARIFAALPGVHSDMFRFQRSTSFCATARAETSRPPGAKPIPSQSLRRFVIRRNGSFVLNNMTEYPLAKAARPTKPKLFTR